jgi:hypothetical protein
MLQHREKNIEYEIVGAKGSYMLTRSYDRGLDI